MFHSTRSSSNCSLKLLVIGAVLCFTSDTNTVECFQSSLSTSSTRAALPKPSLSTMPSSSQGGRDLVSVLYGSKSSGGNYDDMRKKFQNKFNDNDFDDFSDVVDPKDYIPETSFGSENVPEGQRPINEYLDVIRQPFFGWASEEKGDKGLLTRLVAAYAIIFATVCYPISGATYTQDGYLLQKLTSSNVGAMCFLLVLLFRIYSGWSYVGERLQSKVVEYEETGWYDGDFELKTESEKMRDLLLYEQDVKPVVERLKKFGLSLFGMCVISILVCNYTSKPVFDEYDVGMLERLRYDDKLADQAAQNTGGRPAYCDSRYYRALANGGQGCD